MHFAKYIDPAEVWEGEEILPHLCIHNSPQSSLVSRWVGRPRRAGRVTLSSSQRLQAPQQLWTIWQIGQQIMIFQADHWKISHVHVWGRMSQRTTQDEWVCAHGTIVLAPDPVYCILLERPCSITVIRSIPLPKWLPELVIVTLTAQPSLSMYIMLSFVVPSGTMQWCVRDLP